MKNKFLIILLFFLLMAAIPMGFIVKSRTKTTVKSPKNRDDLIVAAAAALCGKDFDDETLKAAVILMKTNAAAGHLPEAEGNNDSDEELYSRVAAIDSESDAILRCNDKTVAVPYCACSNGFTETDADHPCFQAVASPWDFFCPEFDANTHCTGVSMNGVRYLCGEGLSAEEALLWYLPGFEISR